MKMTMNLNNVTTGFYTSSAYAGAGGVATMSGIVCREVSSPLGGVNPVMIASSADTGISQFLTVGSTVAVPDAGDLPEVVGVTNSANQLYFKNGGVALFPNSTLPVTLAGSVNINYRLNISVGATCLDQQLRNANSNVGEGALAKSVYLYIPAYTFNPVFEQAYLSSPIKEIKYTDVYQYQVLNIGPQQNFNNLLTNGIANVKSVLLIPYFSSTAVGAPADLTVGGVTTQLSVNTGFLSGTPVFQSPFDTAGTGTTSPYCYITNFNVQVSGQNAIYNLQRYNFEQFNNQFYGVNAVNGGQTDGITSGLIDRMAFDQNCCFYYVNIERMLPVEETVPKSIQILGTNVSSKNIDLYCFIEYGNTVSIDALTGARV